MKRSEILKLIQEEIECCFDHYDTCTEIYSSDILESSNIAANRVLNLIEKAGMAPPFYNKTLTLQESRVTMDYFGNKYGVKQVREWEPENE